MKSFTEGCTVISWLASKFNKILREHGCCLEHDLFYEQGGSIFLKIWVDILLSKCVVKINDNYTVGLLKATVGFIVLSVNPYTYIVWYSTSLED